VTYRDWLSSRGLILNPIVVNEEEGHVSRRIEDEATISQVGSSMNQSPGLSNLSRDSIPVLSRQAGHYVHALVSLLPALID
jgi:hypothetical protein